MGMCWWEDVYVKILILITLLLSGATTTDKITDVYGKIVVYTYNGTFFFHIFQ